MLDVSARPLDTPEAESFVEQVLAVLRPGRADHRFRTQSMCGTDCDGVQIGAEPQFPGPMFDHESTVLKRFFGRDAVLAENSFKSGIAEKRPGLEQLAGLRRRQPDVAERRPTWLFACDEVPGAVVEVLIVDVPAVLAAERRPASAIEENPRPQLADRFDYLIADDRVGGS
ncbi:hypothetical protein [Lentzea sp. NPDC092896]|uniref:hypothetical protein n=1 Tax=Lentzea sp. NPDC092896 TaxID=3364127 RepID=UPI0038197797